MRFDERDGCFQIFLEGQFARHDSCCDHGLFNKRVVVECDECDLCVAFDVEQTTDEYAVLVAGVHVLIGALV